MKRLVLFFAGLLWFCNLSVADDVWFRFHKSFVQAQIDPDTGIGKLKAGKESPLSAPHPSSCDGHDNELHIGVLRGDMLDPNGHDASGMVNGSEDDDWGVVVEPVNLVATELTNIKSQSHHTIEF